MHKNDFDKVLQGQIKEIMEKLMSMQNVIKEVDLSDIKGQLNVPKIRQRILREYNQN